MKTKMIWLLVALVVGMAVANSFLYVALRQAWARETYLAGQLNPEQWPIEYYRTLQTAAEHFKAEGWITETNSQGVLKWYKTNQ